MEMLGAGEEEQHTESCNISPTYQPHPEYRSEEHIGAVQGGFLFPEISPTHLPSPWLFSHYPTGYIPNHAPDPYPLPILTHSMCDGHTSEHIGMNRETSSPSPPVLCGMPAEFGWLKAPETMDAKVLAASKSHSEAERRRRERINNHLARLRTLLPTTTKKDKASLLAEVIHHVNELKRQTSVLAGTTPVPAETDGVTVDRSEYEGRVVIKASICCDDRNDLLPDLTRTLKALRLRTLKAEIVTLGGRVRNTLLLIGDDVESTGCNERHEMLYVNSIRDALRALMEKTNGEESSPGSVKRQRTFLT